MREPEPLRGVVRGLHHLAIVVRSLEQAKLFYSGVLGMEASASEHVPDQGVNVMILDVAGQRIELVEPAVAGSPIAGFLEKRGEGLHHVAWRVDDCARALGILRERGVRLIDEAPRPGAHGTRIAFLHPKATGGVLMELVEDPASHR